MNLLTFITLAVTLTVELALYWRGCATGAFVQFQSLRGRSGNAAASMLKDLQDDLNRGEITTEQFAAISESIACCDCEPAAAQPESAPIGYGGEHGLWPNAPIDEPRLNGRDRADVVAKAQVRTATWPQSLTP